MKARKFRSSRVSFDEDEGDSASRAGPAPPAPPAPPSIAPAATGAPRDPAQGAGGGARRKKQEQPRAALLSFGDDDEGAAMVASATAPSKQRTSSSSKQHPQSQSQSRVPQQVGVSKFARGAAPVLNTVPAAGTHRSAAGEYTAERLQALQKGTLRLPSALKSQATAASAATVPSEPEPVFKLSGSFKAAQLNGGVRDDDDFYAPLATAQKPSSAAAAAVSASSPQMPLPPPPRRPPQESQQQTLPASRASADPHGAAQPEPGDAEDDEFAVPTKETIRLAKAKRERLRQAHLAPDYIPSMGSATSRLSARDFKSSEGGMESGSDEDDQELRMQFIGKDTAKGVSTAKAAVEGGGLEEDEGEESFAAAQLRKAIRRNQSKGTSSSAADGGGDGSRVETAPRQPATVATARSRKAQIDMEAQAVLQALQAGVSHFQSAHVQAQHNLRRTRKNLDASLQAVGDVEEELRAASSKFQYVQGCKHYVADLCDCLAHKGVIVEELEDHAMQLREGVCQGRRERMQQVEAELRELASLGAGAAQAVLARGGGVPAAAAASSAAVQAGEAKLLDSSEGGKVDEFGRNLDMMEKRLARERAEYRNVVIDNERNILSQATKGLSLKVEEGFDDPEFEAEMARYQSRRQELLEAASTVFADADEEFGSLTAVKNRFERWKREYPKEYQNAYVGLNTPTIFAAYARLELLQWDPLMSNVNPNFDQQEWYHQLFDYGMASDASTALHTDDPDNELVPQIVQNVVTPLALHMVNKCWDPCNNLQSKSVAQIISDLLIYIPAQQEQARELINGVIGTLKNEVEEITAPAWPSSAATASALAEAVCFRTFRKHVRLLRSIASFDELLPRKLLMDIGHKELVNKQMLPYMRSMLFAPLRALVMVEGVVASLPGPWMAKESSAEMKPLVELLHSLDKVLTKDVQGNGLDLSDGNVNLRLMGLFKRTSSAN